MPLSASLVACMFSACTYLLLGLVLSLAEDLGDDVQTGRALLEVLHDQLVGDDLQIANGVDAALNVLDLAGEGRGRTGVRAGAGVEQSAHDQRAAHGAAQAATRSAGVASHPFEFAVCPCLIFSPVLESTAHVEDGIARSDVAEESVTESLSLVRALDQSGDIRDGQNGRGGLGRLGNRHQEVEALIRDGNLGSRRIDGAERVVLSGHCRAHRRTGEGRRSAAKSNAVSEQRHGGGGGLMRCAAYCPLVLQRWHRSAASALQWLSSASGDDAQRSRCRCLSVCSLTVQLGQCVEEGGLADCFTNAHQSPEHE